MKRRYIIIPVAALTALGIGAGLFLANDKVKLVDDKLYIEAGAELDFDISNYIDASKSKLEKLVIDTSKVDTSKVGEYEITITYKEQSLSLKVIVTDTLAPIIEQPQEALKAKIGEEVLIENLGLTIDEVSEYTLTFEDGTTTTTFDTSGETKKKVIATDIYNNTSEIELTFKVGDANNPEIYGYGAKDRVLYLEMGINLLDGVFAKDVEDGDITDKITVSEVDTTTLGKKEVTYTVEDSTGNVSTLTVKITIESVIEELDKTMYATTAISVRDSSSSNGNKLGDLSFSQEVHVTGRDKNTGWYRIDYDGTSAWVSDSYLSDTKPKVETPSVQNNNNNGGQQNTNNNCDCDCDCSGGLGEIDTDGDGVVDYVDIGNGNCPIYSGQEGICTVDDYGRYQWDTQTLTNWDDVCTW